MSRKGPLRANVRASMLEWMPLLEATTSQSLTRLALVDGSVSACLLRLSASSSQQAFCPVASVTCLTPTPGVVTADFSCFIFVEMLQIWSESQHLGSWQEMIACPTIFALRPGAPPLSCTHHLFPSPCLDQIRFPQPQSDPMRAHATSDSRNRIWTHPCKRRY